ncbi:hypothetical protein [Rhodococcus koreensis]|uniref:hypothetical protein n=1 Tax=Rhodococcus koreensis TaxID=99653 RepID=UPI00366F2E5D
MNTVLLNNGVEMPALGFAVHQIPRGATEKADAFAVGYRSLVTDAACKNGSAALL